LELVGNGSIRNGVNRNGSAEKWEGLEMGMLRNGSG